MAPRFSPQFLSELAARIPLSTVVGRHVVLKKRGHEHSGLCPFHGEKSPSFTVNDQKAFYHCFGCGAHGDAISFLTDHEGKSFPEAVEWLAGEAGMSIPQEDPRAQKRYEQAASLRQVVEHACAWFEMRLRGSPAEAYIQKRGLSQDIIKKFRLGYAPDDRGALKRYLLQKNITEAQMAEAGLIIVPDESRANRDSYDRFRGRLMFPITNAKGEVIAFGGRILGAGEPKYLNSPETPLFDKGRTLYGLYNARESKHKTQPLIVVEGYMDVIALHMYGFDRAVAPLGTALTEGHIGLLWRYSDEPILCFDGDKAGRLAALRSAERALPVLEAGKSLQFLSLPQGEDPDSFVQRQGSKAFAAQLSATQPLFEVLYQNESAQGPVDTPERQAGFLKRIKEKCETIKDASLKRLFWEQARSRFNNEIWKARKSKSGQKNMNRAVPMGFKPNAPKANLLLEQAVVAAILNHPSVLDQVTEVLGANVFVEETLEKLRQEILVYATYDQTSEVGTLVDYLEQKGLGYSVLEVCSSKVTALVPFVGKKASIEEVLAGIKRAFFQLKAWSETVVVKNDG